MNSAMKPLKPYLVRAYYEWICDSQYTPYLLVQADLPHVVVPTQYIDPDDGCIVLNISAVAINHFVMDQSHIHFQARFDGVVWDVCVPYYAVAGIYAQENDEGLMFDIQEEEVKQGAEEFANGKNIAAAKDKKPTTAASHPHLRVVKNEQTE